MKLHHFRDAVAIAEHGSLRAAARHLGIAQPTLTRGLSELERELGAPLFERRSKGMLATPLGEAFVRRATAILNDVRRTRDEFEQLRATRLVPSLLGFRSRPIFGFCPKCWSPFGDGFQRSTFILSRGSIRRLSKDFRMAASISMSGQIRGSISHGLFISRSCFRAGEPSCVGQDIRLQMRLRSRT